MLRAAAISLLLVLAPSFALAEKRVALVIGNSAYQHTAKLGNPKNDAADMTAALQSLGFQVIEGRDLDKAAMDRKIRDFASTLAGADIGVFFYAGHGMQVGAQNYLVPVDAQLTTASALDFEMVRLDLLHRTMEREAKTNILFLDACRDNPLARNLARAMGTRTAEIGRGLAAVESGVGTLISFSTQPGNVALDGAGRNSPFAGALVKHILGSSNDLSALLIAVRNDVMAETGRKQVPWEHSALTGQFFFKGSQDPTSTAPAVPIGSTEAAQAWAVAERSNNVAVLEAFISHYGHTFYGAIARSRLAELNNRQLPVATLPKTATSQSQDRIASTSEPKREETKKKSVCDQLIGTWGWPMGLNVTFKKGGAATVSNGDGGTWSCTNGKAVARWRSGMTDHLALSADGLQLSASNNIGYSWSSTRK